MLQNYSSYSFSLMHPNQLLHLNNSISFISKHAFTKGLILTVVLSLFFSCQKMDDTPDAKQYKVAVFLPLSGSNRNDWQKGINWAQENINKNAKITGKKVNISWFDTDIEDIESISAQIASDTTIIAAIGAFTSEEAFKAAPHFIKHKKVMFTLASSERLTRAYAGKNYLWRLIESDISQCKNLILIAKNKGAKSLGIIVGDDAYGESFYNWAGFFAAEMNINVTRLEQYNASEINISENVNLVLQTKPDLIVCVPSSIEHAVKMIDTWKTSDHSCEILFSDLAFMPELLKRATNIEGVEGLVMVPHPDSEFETEYQQRYGRKPLLGIAQVYDALMLIALGYEAMSCNDENTLVDGVKRVVDGRAGNVSLNERGIRDAFMSIKRGEYPDLAGASSSLDYDQYSYLDVISSTYAHWQINLKQFNILNYYSNSTDGRVTNTSSAWKTFARNIEALNYGSHINLPHKLNTNALLVASSKGWSNYRHQSDLLAVYQHLRNNGLSDDDIILIMQDDLAFHQRNKEKGTIKTSENGKNVYKDIVIDYILEELNKDDIFNILSGMTSGKTPTVVHSSDQTNVLFYFIGHGKPEGLLFEGKTNQIITPDYFRERINQIAEQQSFRRLMICIEACYSGSIGKMIAVDSPIMCITATNSSETSKAINYSNTLNSWLSNNFSNHFLSEIESNPELTISELYINLNKRVNGSHVSIYNEENFGNIVSLTINEFLKP